MLLLLLPLRSVLLMLLLTLTPPMPSNLPLLLPSAELTRAVRHGAGAVLQCAVLLLWLPGPSPPGALSLRPALLTLLLTPTLPAPANPPSLPLPPAVLTRAAHHGAGAV